MAKKLKVSVHVGQDDGTFTVYQAGDSPSAADAKKIENPDVWADGSDDEEASVDDSDSAPTDSLPRSKK